MFLSILGRLLELRHQFLRSQRERRSEEVEVLRQIAVQLLYVAGGQGITPDLLERLVAAVCLLENLHFAFEGLRLILDCFGCLLLIEFYAILFGNIPEQFQDLLGFG